MDDPYKNWDGIRREKWLVERALVYSIGTCRSLLNEQQWCQSTVTLCNLGKIEIPPNLCIAFYYYPSFLFFSVLFLSCDANLLA